MKLKYKQVKICVGIVLSLIFLGQGFWVQNAFHVDRVQLVTTIDQAIEVAILREGQIRHEQAGGTFFSKSLDRGQDTARYITKTLRAIDTSFQVTHDLHDPFWEHKFHQFLLIREGETVNVHKLDSIFRKELTYHHFPLKKTAIEYWDIKENKVLDNSISPSGTWWSTSVIPIDTYDTRGVKAYVELPLSTVLWRMWFLLFLSVILIFVCIFFLSIVIRTFFWREKVEKLRQSSVNTMMHEFKRPISAAVAQAALIPHYMEKGDAERVSSYGQGVLLELNKLTAYTERVQKFSNNDKERILLNKEWIKLQDFFVSLVERYREVEDKPIDITLAMDTEEEYIYADLIHFSNMIENLVENAIKYSKEVVDIHISVKDINGKLCISVRDNGLGIAKADVAHVFDKFFRSENPRVQSQVGFGLGLTYVSALADAHDATINVESVLGSWTVFYLSFPILDYA